MTLEEKNLTVSATGMLPRVPFLALKEKILGKKYDLSIMFVTPSKALTLNRTHRNKDYIPDTLSFPLSQTSGEIVLCKSALRTQYKKFGMHYDMYVSFICIHSMLHLIGMKHGSTMEHTEKQLMKLFSISNTHETNYSSRH